MCLLGDAVKLIQSIILFFRPKFFRSRRAQFIQCRLLRDVISRLRDGISGLGLAVPRLPEPFLGRPLLRAFFRQQIKWGVRPWLLIVPGFF